MIASTTTKWAGADKPRGNRALEARDVSNSFARAVAEGLNDADLVAVLVEEDGQRIPEGTTVPLDSTDSSSGLATSKSQRTNHRTVAIDSSSPSHNSFAAWSDESPETRSLLVLSGTTHWPIKQADRTRVSSPPVTETPGLRQEPSNTAMVEVFELRRRALCLEVLIETD
ncbi:hypothetical protein B0T18DRAFT_249278 [Schizothecium vesticola]|uniref:Uncharacterized protein n=1 Tax=Schizothecium vesticola TaxID=314040 RepID=A0AA40EEJ1_9PEZI|nr:hypothetical protein B0T18DRAFT_249278 [Schizothecium vesticola]